ncbi:MAG: hypothetical protein ACJ741_02860 [Pyrinomonadaceae bacterium]
MIEQGTLRLDFLATGTWQHVFVSARGEAREWVYKIPAAFGYVLPFDHPQRFRSENLLTRALHALLPRLPAGRRLLAARLRRRSAEKFEAMLALVEFMCANGLSDIMLPCEIARDAETELRVGGETFTYRGPVLKQQRAARLFERSEGLRSLDWREIVEAHHRLWRRGVTFETPTAVLGLKNWALYEGRLRLFDTSSLTRDPRRVRRALAPDELDRREEWARENQSACGEPSEPLAEFLGFIRREINRAKLEQLWRADVRG